MTKKEARICALRERDKLSLLQREEYSDIIFSTVIKMPEYKNAEKIFLYHSFRSEVDTVRLIDHTITKKGVVYLPRVQDKERISFYPVHDRSGLVKSSWGIFEPSGEDEEESLADLLIIPVAAFSEDLSRAGYGGGYYDRYLKLFKGRVPIAGLCFSCQFVRKFDTEGYDIKPDMIITEKEIRSH